MFLRSADIVLSWVVFVAVATLACDDAKRSVEVKAAEVIGDLASERLASLGETERAANDLINVPIEVRQLADFVWQVRGVSNTHLIKTTEGNVIFDTGLATQAAKQRRRSRSGSDHARDLEPLPSRPRGGDSLLGRTG